MCRRSSRRLLLACAALMGLSLPAAHARAEFPDHPVRLVVPFAAGGGTDIVARLVASRMGERLGQPVVVDNRGGAGGSVGSDLVAKARPDGYTMLMATVSTHAINPALYRNLPFDPIRDFAPVSLLVTVPGVVVVGTGQPYRTAGDLAAALRARPGTVTYGSQGVGGIGHLMGEMFAGQAGGQAVHVPYRGAAPAMQDLVAGRITAVFDTLPGVISQIRAGGVRPLLVASASRLPALLDVPSAPEAGLPGFTAATWNALLAPAGTPAEAIRALNEAAVTALRAPGMTEQLAEMSAEVVGSSPDELGQFMRAELARWAPIVAASGAQVE
ncbi:tripartite tricarboxylate transporter substrate binding protein [Roseomonas sp. KE2513]|uniref:Bug family tripartite tricarboxylate transporter substrate binding protein n=1 Tax=Roseomonas sp. KE2513 TaxID=2479202 RepID=UPI0018E005B7|nr:tripartite tricarboxylate transporter substrate binding protein [Roseomonas sp. KE2513]MBI0538906.1 tripartite tricarboxylate transporter substrate binding protein [Roseomonas sp. KE2513]